MAELKLRKNCPMRHENGNCLPAGGFCTAVNDSICEALHNAFRHGESVEYEKLSLKLIDMNVKYQQESLDTLRKIHEKVTAQTEPERLKSRWEITDIEHAYGKKCYRCSECGEDEWRTNEPNFCPNCGVDMRGESNG